MARSTPKFHGLTRVDATEPLEVPLTERSILDADASDPDHCVLALASKSMRGIKWARFGSRIAYIVFRDNPNVAVRYAIPQGLTRQFDEASEAVKASAKWIKGKTVRLVPPYPTQVLGFKKGSSGTSNRGGKRRRSVHHATPTRHMTFTSDWT